MLNKKFLLHKLLNSYWESPFPSLKISSYFPAYVDIFGHLVGSKCTFIETGVLDGGSLFMWRNWLGKDARIIGIDLNPSAEKWRQAGFEIYIGDQGDPNFWRRVLPEIGEFDALLDDGGHQSFQQIITVVEGMKSNSKDSVIVVEDTATSFMKDFAQHGKKSFLNYAKDCTDILVGRSAGIYHDRFVGKIDSRSWKFFNNCYSVQFYSGIVAFHINHEYSKTPELMRNLPPSSAADFRYEGKSCGSVDWPDIFHYKTVRVHGGKTKLETFREKIKNKFLYYVVGWGVDILNKIKYLCGR
jgi:hypothetical protein